jgi:hypothetical protein
MSNLPIFAIVGHPNEGKSSIVATLAQDDSVAISPLPGETVRLQNFDLKAGDEAVIEFVDTPGFQNPQSTLEWFRDNENSGDKRVEHFIASHEKDPDFHHDCELLRPLLAGAGILYVVDASRPMTSVDLAEMEILRLTARPRMAIINPKSEDQRFLDSWKTAFRQHFNSVRTFNARKARYLDRIELLEALKSIDQDWEPDLSRAIGLVRMDRERATGRAAEAIVDYLAQSLRCRCSSLLEHESGVELEKRRLEKEYLKKLEKIERRFREETRDIFGIHRLKVELPEHSVLSEDLFSERTWQALGLTRNQLTIAGALLGAGLGAGADLAAAGLSFGIFSTVGAAIGGGSALLKGKDLARVKVIEMPLGGLKLTVGPNISERFPFVQLDRFILYAGLVSNWAHARQEERVVLESPDEKQGPSSLWNTGEIKRVTRLVQAVRKNHLEGIEAAGRELRPILVRAIS